MPRKLSFASHRTKDLAEAAAICTAGESISGLERGPGHFVFVFAGPLAQELSQRYWADQLRVDPRHFALQMRSLKDRIHAGSH